MKDCLEDLGVHLKVDVTSALSELKRWTDQTVGRGRGKRGEYCVKPKVFLNILRILRDSISGEANSLHQIKKALESRTLLWLPLTFPFDPDIPQVCLFEAL